jgi:hypothetical protein
MRVHAPKHIEATIRRTSLDDLATDLAPGALDTP